MRQPELAELARRCHKPDHQRIGNWMARRISRPLALRITLLVAPLGVTANMATLAAWACGLAAALVFAGGTPADWLIAALLLQAWYLLDHVDGQLARLRGTASLDGVQLDYLMHHTVNLLVPLGVGYGLAARLVQPGWLLAGTAWGVGLLLLGLQDDTRYKAFILRLKRLRGQLMVEGGGGYKPLPQPPIPRRPLRLARWLAHKACETHVMMNVLSLLAAVAWMSGEGGLLAQRVYLAAMAGLAPLMALWCLARSQRAGAVEAEFTRWFYVPAGHTLVYDEGWWIAEASQDAAINEPGQDMPGRQYSS